MLIRVLLIPDLKADFLFAGPKAAIFLQVDWFRDDDYPLDGSPEMREHATAFIKNKSYYRVGKPFLVLHPLHPFTINYEAS